MNSLTRLRMRANSELIIILSGYLVDNPDIRFSQALNNLNLVYGDGNGKWNDEYYLEPTELLKRVKDK